MANSRHADRRARFGLAIAYARDRSGVLPGRHAQGPACIKDIDQTQPVTGLHGQLGVFGFSPLMQADDLGRMRRVERADLAFGLDAASADDQIVFAAQMRAYRSQRCFHRSGALWRLEVDERFIGKRALRQSWRNQG